MEKCFWMWQLTYENCVTLVFLRILDATHIFCRRKKLGINYYHYHSTHGEKFKFFKQTLLQPLLHPKPSPQI